MMNKYTEMLAEKHMKAQTDLIKLAMPDNAVMARVRLIEHGMGGKTVYEFDGKPFLEVYPPTFESVLENGCYKIKAKQNYKVFKND